MHQLKCVQREVAIRGTSSEDRSDGRDQFVTAHHTLLRGQARARSVKGRDRKLCLVVLSLITEQEPSLMPFR